MENYINGAFAPPRDGHYLDLYEPATGRIYARAPASTSTDVAAAVESAQAAFPAWAAMPIDERARYLLAIAERIEGKLDDLAAAESRDNGKPVSLARQVDIPRAAANFRFFGHAITQFASEAHEMTGVAINYTLRQPLGVVGCISPWNLPLYLFTWKIAPALAAGNTVVAKPSEVTPYTAYLLSRICDEVKLPPGVLNIVHGHGHEVGDAINRHPAIKAISFTGSTRTGAEIARVAAPMFKKLSLEMGGKNPNLIFADCDYERALDTTVRSSFANQGQICLCGSRIYVQRPIYERFRDDLVERARALKVGDPKAPGTNLGAVVSKEHLSKIIAYIKLAREEGGRILCGGEQLKLAGELANGYYVAPTVLEGLGPQCRVMREEIFGPVVSITPFEDEEEALALANGTSYGLAATLWTENLSRAHRLAAHLQAGIVWINTWMLRDLRTPFGGMKHSGVGREGGWEALRFFTEPKNVCVRWDGRG